MTSGLARGIDTAAHQGALGAQGRTIAVVAGGLDVPYPAENTALQARIAAEGGVVASEAPLGTAPMARHFPRRNRIVAGLVLIALYGKQSPLGVNWQSTEKAIFLALAFVTLPFIVRTVQPVLEELEHDVEEAASSLGANRLTVFRRIILPSLFPAIAAGAALSFARAISEYGSLVLITGNLPYRTEVVSVRVVSFIEGGNTGAAAALATVMLAVALFVIVAVDIIQRKVARRG